MQPITADRNSATSQSGYEAIACDRCKARETARTQVVIGFVMHWLKKRPKLCWPITERDSTKPNQRTSFDAQFKPALMSLHKSITFSSCAFSLGRQETASVT